MSFIILDKTDGFYLAGNWGRSSTPIYALEFESYEKAKEYLDSNEMDGDFEIIEKGD